MAISNSNSSSIYGLLNPQKGKLSLQTLGGNPSGDETLDENGLPQSPFANLPIGINGTGVPGAVPQIPSIVGANIPQGFQFTGEYDARNRGLLQQESDAGLQRKNTLASIAEQYLQATRQAEQQQGKGRKSLFAELADRGALGSGAALESVGDFETTYNDYLSNLSRGRAADMANTEGSYASILNQLGRSREGLVGEQQKAEEARRLQEEQVRAQAERDRAAEEQRRSQINALIEGQNQARAAAEAAARAASAAQSSFSVGGFGGGGGYSGAPGPAAAQPVQGYKAGEQRITMPPGVNGMDQGGWANWVHNNIDANASPAAVQAVLKQLMKDQPNGGTPISDLAWLIQQYPNATQPTNDRTTYGGRFQ